MKLSRGQAGISLLTGLGAMCALVLPWNGYLSIEQIGQGKQLAAISQWQQDFDKNYGSKIDYLVERNGANPEALVKYYRTASTSNEQSYNQ